VWLKVALVIVGIVALLKLSRSRDSLETFFTCVAALAVLFAIASTTGDFSEPRVWLIFTGAVATAAVCVFLTKGRRTALLAIAVIVGFRFLIYLLRLVAAI
jgi:hypothetical protein